MSVLVDTSVWLDFFSARPRVHPALLDHLSLLLEDGQVVTIHPIVAELL